MREASRHPMLCVERATEVRRGLDVSGECSDWDQG